LGDYYFLKGYLVGVDPRSIISKGGEIDPDFICYFDYSSPWGQEAMQIMYFVC